MPNKNKRIQKGIAIFLSASLVFLESFAYANTPPRAFHAWKPQEFEQYVNTSVALSESRKRPSIKNLEGLTEDEVFWIHGISYDQARRSEGADRRERDLLLHQTWKYTNAQADVLAETDTERIRARAQLLTLLFQRTKPKHFEHFDPTAYPEVLRNEFNGAVVAELLQEGNPAAFDRGLQGLVKTSGAEARDYVTQLDDAYGHRLYKNLDAEIAAEKQRKQAAESARRKEKRQNKRRVDQINLSSDESSRKSDWRGYIESLKLYLSGGMHNGMTRVEHRKSLHGKRMIIPRYKLIPKIFEGVGIGELLLFSVKGQNVLVSSKAFLRKKDETFFEAEVRIVGHGEDEQVKLLIREAGIRKPVLERVWNGARFEHHDDKHLTRELRAFFEGEGTPPPQNRIMRKPQNTEKQNQTSTIYVFKKTMGGNDGSKKKYTKVPAFKGYSMLSYGNKRKYWMEGYLDQAGIKWLHFYLQSEGGEMVSRARWNEETREFDYWEGPLLGKSSQSARRRLDLWARNSLDTNEVNLDMPVTKVSFQKGVAIIQREQGGGKKDKRIHIRSRKMVHEELLPVKAYGLPGEKRVLIRLPTRKNDAGKVIRKKANILRYIRGDSVLTAREELLQRFDDWISSDSDYEIPNPIVVKMTRFGEVFFKGEDKDFRVRLGEKRGVDKVRGRDVFIVFEQERRDGVLVKKIKIYGKNSAWDKQGRPAEMIWSGQFDPKKKKLVEEKNFQPRRLMGAERYRVQREAATFEYAPWPYSLLTKAETTLLVLEALEERPLSKEDLIGWLEARNHAIDHLQGAIEQLQAYNENGEYIAEVGSGKFACFHPTPLKKDTRKAGRFIHESPRGAFTVSHEKDLTQKSIHTAFENKRAIQIRVNGSEVVRFRMAWDQSGNELLASGTNRLSARAEDLVFSNVDAMPSAPHEAKMTAPADGMINIPIKPGETVSGVFHQSKLVRLDWFSGDEPQHGVYRVAPNGNPQRPEVTLRQGVRPLRSLDIIPNGKYNNLKARARFLQLLGMPLDGSPMEPGLLLREMFPDSSYHEAGAMAAEIFVRNKWHLQNARLELIKNHSWLPGRGFDKEPINFFAALIWGLDLAADYREVWARRSAYGSGGITRSSHLMGVPNDVAARANQDLEILKQAWVEKAAEEARQVVINRNLEQQSKLANQIDAERRQEEEKAIKKTQDAERRRRMRRRDELLGKAKKKGSSLGKRNQTEQASKTKQDRPEQPVNDEPSDLNAIEDEVGSKFVAADDGSHRAKRLRNPLRTPPIVFYEPGTHYTASEQDKNLENFIFLVQSNSLTNPRLLAEALTDLARVVQTRDRALIVDLLQRFPINIREAFSLLIEPILSQDSFLATVIDYLEKLNQELLADSDLDEPTPRASTLDLQDDPAPRAKEATEKQTRSRKYREAITTVFEMVNAAAYGDEDFLNQAMVLLQLLQRIRNHEANEAEEELHSLSWVGRYFDQAVQSYEKARPAKTEVEGYRIAIRFIQAQFKRIFSPKPKDFYAFLKAEIEKGSFEEHLARSFGPIALWAYAELSNSLESEVDKEILLYYLTHHWTTNGKWPNVVHLRRHLLDLSQILGVDYYLDTETAKHRLIVISQTARWLGLQSFRSALSNDSTLKAEADPIEVPMEERTIVSLALTQGSEEVLENKLVSELSLLASEMRRTSAEPDGLEYYLIYKPTEVLSKPELDARRSIFELFEGKTGKNSKGFYPVGRLDYDVSGLMIFTNDPAMVSILTRSNHVEKHYRAKVKGKVAEETLEPIRKGTLQVRPSHLKFPPYVPGRAKIKIIEVQGDYSVIDLWISEGRYHQVKDMMRTIGHPIVKHGLQRLGIGSLHLRQMDLKLGDVRLMRTKRLKGILEMKELAMASLENNMLRATKSSVLSLLRFASDMEVNTVRGFFHQMLEVSMGDQLSKNLAIDILLETVWEADSTEIVREAGTALIYLRRHHADVLRERFGYRIENETEAIKRSFLEKTRDSLFPNSAKGKSEMRHVSSPGITNFVKRIFPLENLQITFYKEMEDVQSGKMVFDTDVQPTVSLRRYAPYLTPEIYKKLIQLDQFEDSNLSARDIALDLGRKAFEEKKFEYVISPLDQLMAEALTELYNLPLKNMGAGLATFLIHRVISSDDFEEEMNVFNFFPYDQDEEYLRPEIVSLVKSLGEENIEAYFRLRVDEIFKAREYTEWLEKKEAVEKGPPSPDIFVSLKDQVKLGFRKREAKGMPSPKNLYQSLDASGISLLASIRSSHRRLSIPLQLGNITVDPPFDALQNNQPVIVFKRQADERYHATEIRWGNRRYGMEDLTPLVRRAKAQTTKNFGKVEVVSGRYNYFVPTKLQRAALDETGGVTPGFGHGKFFRSKQAAVKEALKAESGDSIRSGMVFRVPRLEAKKTTDKNPLRFQSLEVLVKDVQGREKWVSFPDYIKYKKHRARTPEDFDARRWLHEHGLAFTAWRHHAADPLLRPRNEIESILFRQGGLFSDKEEWWDHLEAVNSQDGGYETRQLSLHEVSSTPRVTLEHEGVDVERFVNQTGLEVSMSPVTRVAPGTEIYPSYPGKVVVVSDKKEYIGEFIVVQHPNKRNEYGDIMYSVYSHTKADVKVGQSVTWTTRLGWFANPFHRNPDWKGAPAHLHWGETYYPAHLPPEQIDWSVYNPNNDLVSIADPLENEVLHSEPRRQKRLAKPISVEQRVNTAFINLLRVFYFRYRYFPANKRKGSDLVVAKEVLKLLSQLSFRSTQDAPLLFGILREAIRNRNESLRDQIIETLKAIKAIPQDSQIPTTISQVDELAIKAAKLVLKSRRKQGSVFLKSDEKKAMEERIGKIAKQTDDEYLKKELKYAAQELRGTQGPAAERHLRNLEHQFQIIFEGERGKVQRDNKEYPFFPYSFEAVASMVALVVKRARAGEIKDVDRFKSHILRVLRRAQTQVSDDIQARELVVYGTTIYALKFFSIIGDEQTVENIATQTIYRGWIREGAQEVLRSMRAEAAEANSEMRISREEFLTAVKADPERGAAIIKNGIEHNIGSAAFVRVNIRNWGAEYLLDQSVALAQRTQFMDEVLTESVHKFDPELLSSWKEKIAAHVWHKLPDIEKPLFEPDETRLTNGNIFTENRSGVTIITGVGVMDPEGQGVLFGVDLQKEWNIESITPLAGGSFSLRSPSHGAWVYDSEGNLLFHKPPIVQKQEFRVFSLTNERYAIAYVEKGRAVFDSYAHWVSYDKVVVFNSQGNQIQEYDLEDPSWKADIIGESHSLNYNGKLGFYDLGHDTSIWIDDSSVKLAQGDQWKIQIKKGDDVYQILKGKEVREYYNPRLSKDGKRLHLHQMNGFPFYRLVEVQSTVETFEYQDDLAAIEAYLKKKMTSAAKSETRNAGDKELPFFMFGESQWHMQIELDVLEQATKHFPGAGVLYPGAGADGDTVRDVVEQFPMADTFVLVDPAYGEAGDSTRNELLESLQRNRISVDFDDRQALLDRRFDDQGRLEFRAMVQPRDSGEPRPINIVIYARDFLDTDFEIQDFPKGVGLSIVQDPDTGGGLSQWDTTNSDDQGLEFYSKIFANTAINGLIYVSRAYLPNEAALDGVSLEILHQPDEARFPTEKLRVGEYYLYRILPSSEVRGGEDIEFTHITDIHLRRDPASHAHALLDIGPYQYRLTLSALREAQLGAPGNFMITQIKGFDEAVNQKVASQDAVYRRQIMVAASMALTVLAEVGVLGSVNELTEEAPTVAARAKFSQNEIIYKFGRHTVHIDFENRVIHHRETELNDFSFQQGDAGEAFRFEDIEQSRPNGVFMRTLLATHAEILGIIGNYQVGVTAQQRDGLYKENFPDLVSMLTALANHFSRSEMRVEAASQGANVIFSIPARVLESLEYVPGKARDLYRELLGVKLRSENRLHLVITGSDDVALGPRALEFLGMDQVHLGWRRAEARLPKNAPVIYFEDMSRLEEAASEVRTTERTHIFSGVFEGSFVQAQWLADKLDEETARSEFRVIRSLSLAAGQLLEQLFHSFVIISQAA